MSGPDTTRPDMADALTALGRHRFHPPGSVLFFEGDPAHDVVLVVDGEVKLERMVGDRPVILDLLGPGDWFGEMGVLDGGVRSATATTLTRAELRVVPGSAFVGLLGARPRLMADLLRVSGRRLARASGHQAEMGATDALGRVCGRLVDLADRYGRRSQDGIVVRSPLSQAEIASWAGMSRESVVKSLATLRDRGWVRTRGRRITLVDLDSVRDRSGVAA